MFRLRPPIAVVLATLAASFVAVPAAGAQAPAPTATGGAAFGNAGPTGLDVDPGGFLGRPLAISGRVESLAGQAVRIERLDAATRAWVAVARATADEDGAFSAQWDPDIPGDQTLRAVPDTGSAAQASTADAGPSARTTIYRSAGATWYGPGFWGRTTACGVRLTKTLLGVAHRTWPCGTRVAVYLDGRQTEVTVVDRGPYAKGVSLDLTKAAADQIGLTEIGRGAIGWYRRPAAANVR
ncbi:septal ring lytic transglycosylase RlpA family protein [Capillimicrobium parvum]|uniref:Endolytic peptidoglycan transglycosylase RlpA n=1 Tax=Capillimicrobium parvum TaxID=2884022 RepID=A0A9E6XV14_9ACTN|nr:septal ring lytic transglycosylase RlpA family protein [Capillimicrobium parvum]UGS34985.1 Endolytic peptidoglycan transglycosylase RlpA [Capillimicrobium parvum]